MPINKNHMFKDLDGIRNTVVEQKIPESRMQFLKALLESNGYKVTVETVPAPKPKPAPPVAEGDAAVTQTAPEPPPALPDTYTLYVTDVTFNATNAVFGRLLKTPEGRVVTLAYWQQKEKQAGDEPYFSSGQ